MLGLFVACNRALADSLFKGRGPDGEVAGVGAAPVSTGQVA